MGILAKWETCNVSQNEYVISELCRWLVETSETSVKFRQEASTLHRFSNVLRVTTRQTRDCRFTTRFEHEMVQEKWRLEYAII